ncbi:hypothetical protein FB45DRAFT_1000315 [Roridomyces roridus]|uniref:F-box domain-containing protein n=1 Tax=Roridomyces roridus TaxID=1738132 RepID=A0AAD7C8I9_9AGAR|nr:hypothetical protein FB45DRAFT_1000315 [Roridomyces roridus]
MSKLPPELFNFVLNELRSGGDDAKTLFDLRLVSKPIKQITTPLAFKGVAVRASVKSAEAVSVLQDSEDESLRDAVKEVVFRGDERVVLREGNAAEETAALVKVFSGLAKFPRLESLQLDLHDQYEEDRAESGPTSYLRLQLALFESLTTNHPPSLTSLALNNVIAKPDSIYTRDDFKVIFQPLQRLELSILSEDPDCEGSYAEQPLVDFWAKSIPSIIRNATSLTSLTLRSTAQWVGAMSFKDIFLPELSELVLHKFILEPMMAEYDTVEFILRHKNTLTRLELSSCSIGGGEEGTPMPRLWHAVFKSFEKELVNLKEFVLLDEEGGEDFDERLMYTVLLAGDGYAIAEDEIGGGEEDLAALESLREVMNSRNTFDE